MVGDKLFKRYQPLFSEDFSEEVLDNVWGFGRLCPVMNRNELENVVLIVMIFLVLSMGVSLIKLAAVIGKVIFGA